MSKLSIGSDIYGEVHESMEFEGDDFRVFWNGDNTAYETARQQMRATNENGWSQSRDMRQIAMLGPAEIMLIAGMYGVRPLSREFDDVVLKLFQDPDWAKLKTVDGRVRSKLKAPTCL